MGGLAFTRILDELRLSRSLPRVIRTGNGKESCGKATLIWAQTRGVRLRQIEPGKPNQNAHIELFNEWFREECLSEHWLLSLGTQDRLSSCRRAN